MFDRHRPILIALTVAGAFFMENLDGTVIATALPQMARSFGTSPINLSVGMTAYILALAVFIPISGWTADRFGSRSVFGAAIVVFTLTSLLCGASNGVWSFTAARVAQGIGGAMMVPVGRLVVLRSTEKQHLMRAMAYITWPGLAAPVIGPPVGGFITTYANWRWVFWLNLPLGVLALVLVAILFRNESGRQRRPFDAIGFVLSGIALPSLMNGLNLAARPQAQWGVTTAVLVGSLLFAALAVRHFRRTDNPLVDLAALRLPTFSVTVWAGSLFRIAIGSIPFLVPLLLQVAFGLSALRLRLADLGDVRRQSGHEVHHHANPAPLRLPRRANRQWPDCGRHYCRVRLADAGYANFVNGDRVVRWGAVPLDAVYLPEYNPVCRHPAAQDELGQQLFQRGAAVQHGHGHGHRRRRCVSAPGARDPGR